ncbi:Tektin [Diplonema papillatum]|nr:Tektin [Diplonema papillatum]
MVNLASSGRGMNDTKDWETNTSVLLDVAHAKNEDSGRSRFNEKVVAHRLEKDTRLGTSRVMIDLKAKIAETESLRAKLVRATQQLEEEMALLQRGSEATEKLLLKQNVPLSTALHRLRERKTKRPTRENINDVVQDALQSESEELTRCVQGLSLVHSESLSLLTRMGRCLAELREDTADKTSGLALDRSCLHVVQQPLECLGATPNFAAEGQTPLTHQAGALRPPRPQKQRQPLQSPGKGYGGLSFETLSTVGTELRHVMRMARNNPVSWKSFTSELLATAGSLVSASVAWRKLAAAKARKTAHVGRDCARRTRDAFGDKIKQTARLHQKLQGELAAVAGEIAQLETEREQMASALDTKRGPLVHCTQQLQMRQYRPDREHVNDNAERSLHAHLTTLMSTRRGLEVHLTQIAARQRELESLQRELSMDLQDKADAKDLDQQLLRSSLDKGMMSAGALLNGSVAGFSSFGNSLGTSGKRDLSGKFRLPSSAKSPHLDALTHQLLAQSKVPTRTAPQISTVFGQERQMCK